MSGGEHIHKLAEWSGKGESPAMHRILECAMTDEEARFLLDLPASTADLAAKYGMDEKAVEAKVLNLARRGLVVSSRKGIRYPRNPSTLHDNILSSAEEQIPAEMGKLWMDLYDGEGWGEEIGQGMAAFGITALRTIPGLNSVPSGVQLLPHESIEAIIEANRDLISLRHCCCRRGAKKCSHPTEVCIQFGRRAEYDLYRSSGRKLTRGRSDRGRSRGVRIRPGAHSDQHVRNAGARVHLLLLRLLLSGARSGLQGGGDQADPRAEPI